MWTQGESDSRPPDANRMHYHYAMGPSEEKMNVLAHSFSTNEGTISPKAIWAKL